MATPEKEQMARAIAAMKEPERSRVLGILDNLKGFTRSLTLRAKAQSNQGYRVFTFADLRERAQDQTTPVVETLVPARTINLAAGDSGIGKSPFFYQMAFCVGAGIPFLGYPTQQRKVVIVDSENGDEASVSLEERLCEHLRVDLQMVEQNVIVVRRFDSSQAFADMVREVRPGLIIIDTLRTFEPDAEMKPNEAAKMLGDLHMLAQAYDTSIILIHHLKKPDKEHPRPKLADTQVLEWLQSACGVRALVNQTDVRIGLDASGSDDAPALTLRGFQRVVGEFGPFTIERLFSDDGEAIGYQRKVGTQLLENFVYQEAFRKLPDVFRFKDVESILNRGKSSVVHFLNKCATAGILSKDAHSKQYRKVHTAPARD